MKAFLLALTVLTSALLSSAKASENEAIYWMKLKANNKYDRTKIANTGVTIEAIREDFVAALGNQTELKKLQKMGLVEVSFEQTEAMDFPSKDSAFHNYNEMSEKLTQLAKENPEFTSLTSIGKSTEGREIYFFRIMGDLQNADNYPAISIMGGHHAREHLSIELPINYIEYLITEYKNGNPRIQKLVNSRDIHILPMINPDGAEYDIEGGKYKMWRKNRAKNHNSTFGVDLNRNYGFKWGTGGSSTNPNSDTYMGKSAFSEPETQAVKKYIEDHKNISINLSFHTYSQLILYPWGHTYSGIQNDQDRQVHETMAKQMSEWNGYTPQQSSALYIASGDTTDWTYGEHRIISFTFELDPKDQWGGGGFYPGAGVIKPVTEKNLEPILYLIEYSDNPYRVLDKSGPILRP